MNYNEYMANIKAYRNGTLMQAAPTDALSDWHEKYFDTAVSALSKKMIADHVEHSEDADKFGKDFVSLVAILEEDGVSKQDIGKELEAVSKAAQSQADAAIKKIDSVQHSTDTLEGYKAAIKAYKEKHLEHGEWKKHKYIRIENGRYIYPEDKKSGDNRTPIGTRISNAISKFNASQQSQGRSNETPLGKLKQTVNAFKEAGQKLGEAVRENKAEKDAKLTKIGNEISKYVAKDSDSYNKLMDAAKSILKEDSKASISVSYDKDSGNVKLTNDDAYYNPATQRQSDAKTVSSSAKADPETIKKNELAEKNKKEFEESTKQLSPQEQYKKVEAEKAAAEKKETPKQNTPEKKTDESHSDYGNSDQIKKAVKADVNQLLFELTGGRVTQGEDAYKTYRDNSVKAHDEYIQEGEKQGISSVVLNNIYGYEQCKAVLESLEKYNEMGLISQESYDMGKGLYEYNLKKFKSLPAVKEYIETGKMPKEVPFEEKKVQHSDPRAAFYAAVDDYKSKKGLNQRVPL